jgi:hypothetical protein
MPRGIPQFCACGCGVTPNTYREKFLDTWSTGYPYVDSGMYYCSRYGQTNEKGYTCWSVVAVSEIDKTTHIDHILPKKQGGADCINNLRIMCMHCNTSKKHYYTKSSKACEKKSSKSIADYIGDNITSAKNKRSKNKSRNKAQTNDNVFHNQDYNNFQVDYTDLDVLTSLGIL